MQSLFCDYAPLTILLEIMEIHAPIWFLKQICGECEQGSCLMLVVCPNCNHVAVVCTECGTAFLNPTQIKSQDCLAHEAACPVFQKIRIADFRAANSTEIQAAGLLASQYC